MSVFDWRPASPKIRSDESVRKELMTGRLVDVTPSGVVIELPSGERVEYAAVGYEFDMELNRVG